MNNNITVSLKQAPELTAEEIAIWREFCASHCQLKSPILSPDFFQLIASIRDDAYVAIYRQSGKIIGILGHHRRPNRFARPIGAPFSDYTAFLTPPEPIIKIHDALKLIDIDNFQAIGIVDPFGSIGEIGGYEDEAFAIDINSDIEAHSANKKHRKNVRRLIRHLNESVGETRFIFDDRSQSNFDRMIELKKIQINSTGIHDFVSPPWVKEMFKKMFEADRSGLHGSLMTLMSGDKPIAMHFGPRLGSRMHPWIATYDQDYFKYSPGQIFLVDCPEVLKQNQIDYYDLSTGSEGSYKKTFTNSGFKVRNATIHSSGKIDIPKTGIMLRLNRRIDQIAALELDFSTRTKGIFGAFLSMSKRLKSQSSV